MIYIYSRESENAIRTALLLIRFCTALQQLSTQRTRRRHGKLYPSNNHRLWCPYMPLICAEIFQEQSGQCKALEKPQGKTTNLPASSFKSSPMVPPLERIKGGFAHQNPDVADGEVDGGRPASSGMLWLPCGCGWCAYVAGEERCFIEAGGAAGSRKKTRRRDLTLARSSALTGRSSPRALLHNHVGKRWPVAFQ